MGDSDDDKKIFYMSIMEKVHHNIVMIISTHAEIAHLVTHASIFVKG